MAQSTACASGELMSFTSATVVAPAFSNTCMGSNKSGLRPDCEMDTASTRCRAMGAL